MAAYITEVPGDGVIINGEKYVVGANIKRKLRIKESPSYIMLNGVIKEIHIGDNEEIFSITYICDFDMPSNKYAKDKICKTYGDIDDVLRDLHLCNDDFILID